ncbi:MAG: PIG-L family deacetylase [Acidimicrobiia bacterium]|nr:PIG-L family deacetylase [Acidimicrobiia bacterium]
MRSQDLAIPERALAIGAHPDDIELHAGATLAKWSALGCEVSLLVCTDGSKGTWDPQANLKELVAQRQAEQQESANRLGVGGEVIFLGWVDGELDSGAQACGQVAAHIRRLRPNVVIGHDPWRRWRLHPDHRHAGWLTTNAIVAARDPHFLPKLDLPPHRPDTLLLFEADEPDHAETTTGYDTIKTWALQAFVSQYKTTLGLPTTPSDNDLAGLKQRVAEELAQQGTTAGLPSAELFKLIDSS